MIVVLCISLRRPSYLFPNNNLTRPFLHVSCCVLNKKSMAHTLTFEGRIRSNRAPANSLGQIVHVGMA